MNDHFVGPAVAVFLIEMGKSTVLENASIRQAGDHAFVVGTVPAKPFTQDTRAGLTLWINCDQVKMLTAFPDLKSAEESWDECMAQKPRRWWQDSHTFRAKVL